MRLSKAWIIASRDFKIFRHQKNIWYSIIVVPLIISIIFPLILEFAGRRTGGIPVAQLPPLLNSFSFFFVIAAVFIPISIASYSIVGEKIEKSLEPLLATPITDGEILFGKTLSALLPVLASLYVGASIFMVLVDEVTFHKLGYYYFPNWSIGVILVILVPIAVTLSVEFSVIVSSRVNDVRSANSYGILMLLPLGGIYLAGELGLISLDTTNLFIISGIFLALDVILFFVSTAAFRREEILTKWK
ncbi:MAG: ABC transporter permease subunit [Candidatus Bathyarchaeia archaeon]|jgi:ABC-2 type transport system permease protein